jgi:SAM-dependent methyltransferase
VESNSWKPHGLALLDYCRGDTSAAVVVHGEDGEQELVPIQVFFRGPSEFSALEEAALDLCRGRVLDVGAGAGCHSLVLQERNFGVYAIDILPEAIEVMRLRGVSRARCADIFTFPAESFDTLLLMMNGAGIAGTLSGLRRFLQQAHRIVAPDGQILLDSYDPGCPEKGKAEDADTIRAESTRYAGEMRFRLEYQGRRGPPYDWLFIDFDTLARQTRAMGWHAEVIWYEEEGHYLARLSAR